MVEKESETESQASTSDFPECRYVALEEFRRLLGLTQDDLGCFIKVLSKSELCMINFSFGDLSVSMNGCDDEISLSFELERKGMERSAQYNFNLASLGFMKNQKKLKDFGGE